MVHKLDDLSLIIDTTIIEKEIDENQGTAVQKTNNQDHTAGLDTIFVLIYMNALPGVQGVSKYQNFFFTNKTVEFLR